MEIQLIFLITIVTPHDRPFSAYYENNDIKDLELKVNVVHELNRPQIIVNDVVIKNILITNLRNQSYSITYEYFPMIGDDPVGEKQSVGMALGPNESTTIPMRYQLSQEGTNRIATNFYELDLNAKKTAIGHDTFNVLVITYSSLISFQQLQTTYIAILVAGITTTPLAIYYISKIAKPSSNPFANKPASGVG